MAETAKVRRTARLAGDASTEIRCDGASFEDAAKHLFHKVDDEMRQMNGVSPTSLEVEVRDPDDGAGWRKFQVKTVTHLEVIGLRGGE